MRAAAGGRRWRQSRRRGGGGAGTCRARPRGSSDVRLTFVSLATSPAMPAISVIHLPRWHSAAQKQNRRHSTVWPHQFCCTRTLSLTAPMINLTVSNILLRQSHCICCLTDTNNLTDINHLTAPISLHPAARMGQVERNGSAATVWDDGPAYAAISGLSRRS